MLPPAGLLRAIDDDPDDPAPYLVYADYLLERGDVLGELIQVQLQLETLAADDPSHMAVARRQVELLDLLAPAWDSLDATWRFRRGFLDELSLPASIFREHAPLATDLSRLRRLELGGAGGGARGRDRGTAPRFGDADLEVVLALPALRGLVELSLVGCRLGAAAGRALAAADLPRLRSLTLADLASRGPSEVVAAFVESPPPRLPALESLALTTDRLTDDLAVALASWPHLAQLRALDLSSVDTYDPGCNAISDRGGIALVSSPHAARLARLDLCDNPRITNATALALAASRLAELVELDLSFTALDDVGAAALAGSPVLARLSHLDVSHTRVGDAGISALLRLPALASLDLSGTPLTADGIRALVSAPARLTSLRLVQPRIDLPPDLLSAFLLRFGTHAVFY